MKLRPPVFTIGQVWYDFVKRLPRTRPRYRIEVTAFQQQASAQQFAALAALQQQYGSFPPNAIHQQMFNPYGYNGNPIGCGLGWNIYK